MAGQSAFSFLELNVSYGGEPITGFAPGSGSIDWVFDKDMVNKKVGPDGEGAFNLIQDRSGTVTLKLLCTAASNDYLASIYVPLSAGAFVTLPLLISDTYGNTKLFGNFAIQKCPDVKFGEELEDREWKLVALKMVAVPGRVGKAIT